MRRTRLALVLICAVVGAATAWQSPSSAADEPDPVSLDHSDRAHGITHGSLELVQERSLIHGLRMLWADGESDSVHRIFDDVTDELLFERVDLSHLDEPSGTEAGASAGHGGSETTPSSCTNEGTGKQFVYTNGYTNTGWTVTENWQFNPAGAPATVSDWRAQINAGEDAWERTLSNCGATDIISFNHNNGTDTTRTANVSSDLMTCNASDGTNAISFRAAGTGNGRLAVTCVWVSAGTGRPFEADIAFNTSYVWANTAVPNAYDLRSVAVHEFGHYLGFDHSNSDSVMHPTIASNFTGRRLLSLGDVDIASKTYPVGTRYDSLWQGQGISYIAPTTYLGAGRSYTTWVDIKNNGGMPWAIGGRVRLGTSNPQDRCSAFATGWIGCNRPTAVDSNVTSPGRDHIRPGEVGRFQFNIKGGASHVGNTYREYFRPMAESVTWMRDEGIYFDYKFGTYASTLGTVSGPGTMLRGTTSAATVNIKNTGTAPWFVNDVIRLGTSGPQNRCSAFSTTGWSGCARPSNVTSNVTQPGASYVLPGQTGQFSFNMQAPSTPGSYVEKFQPLGELVNWMSPVATFNITVL